MKISIITCSYNAINTIEETIRSVLLQKDADIEYIVIDGLSDDGTAGIIKKYSDKIYKFISEKDSGIYNAMNKGIKLAGGDIVGFLNADDVYFNEKIINEVIKVFENEKVDSVYGDLIYVSEYNNKIKRYWESGDFNIDNFKRGWMPPHPAFFVKRDVYERYGGFNENYKISADYELMVRLLYKNKISSFYLPEILVKMKTGGISNKISQTFKRLKEDYDIIKEYNLGSFGGGLDVMFKKRFYKINQYFNKKI
jgi:glycosyltransferase